jgi:FkbM family methyltransferase
MDIIGKTMIPVFEAKSCISEIVYDKIYDYWTLQKDWIVVDLGAYCGEYSLYVADKVAKVYAIEPQKTIFDLMIKNIEMNNLKDKILPFQILITDRDGKEKFYYDNGVSSSIYETAKSLHNFTKEIDMECTTWNSFCIKNEIARIDLLKMDVEGAEGSVLRGLGDNKPIRIMVSYYHGFLTSVLHKVETEHELIQMLINLGYKIVYRNKHTLFAELIEGQ